MPAPDPKVILTALSHGVVGDHARALDLLQPIVDAGPRSTYSLLGSLAECATYLTRRAGGPGADYRLEVEGPDGPASADVLLPPIRFAARFVTAWANRDQETAYALFRAVADHADTHGTSDLADGVRAVYEMAVAAADAVVADQRARRTGGPR